MNITDHAMHGAYRCNNCAQVRWITMLPAIIDGCIEKLTIDDIGQIHCSECNSDNCIILFATNDKNEAQAYAAAIEALEKND